LPKKACHKTQPPYNAPSLTRREVQITKWKENEKKKFEKTFDTQMNKRNIRSPGERS